MAEHLQPEGTSESISPRWKSYGEPAPSTPKVLSKFLALSEPEQGKVWEKLDEQQKQGLFQRMTGELMSFNEGLTKSDPIRNMTPESKASFKESILSVAPLRIMAKLVSSLSSTEKHPVSVEDAEGMLMEMQPQTGLISANTLAARVVKTVPPELRKAMYPAIKSWAKSVPKFTLEKVKSFGTKKSSLERLYKKQGVPYDPEREGGMLGVTMTRKNPLASDIAIRPAGRYATGPGESSTISSLTPVTTSIHEIGHVGTHPAILMGRAPEVEKKVIDLLKPMYPDVAATSGLLSGRRGLTRVPNYLRNVEEALAESYAHKKVAELAKRNPSLALRDFGSRPAPESVGAYAEFLMRGGK